MRQDITDGVGFLIIYVLILNLFKQQKKFVNFFVNVEVDIIKKWVPPLTHQHLTYLLTVWLIYGVICRFFSDLSMHL